MKDPKRLFLYEEIMLLSLRNDKGTLSTSVAEYAVAGALMAELLLEGRISFGDPRKQLIDVREKAPTGDPILDESLKRMAESKKRASLTVWITRLATAKDLRHRVARQLCARNILRADEETLLLLFKRKIYPEVNSEPERQIVDRMRAAVASSAGPVDPRTVVLISLAQGMGLLKGVLGHDDAKRFKQRIKQIIEGELTGKATKEIVEASHAAMTVAIVLPTIIASTSR